MKIIIWVIAFIVVIAGLFYINVSINATQSENTITSTSSNMNAPVGAYELQGGIDANDLQPATFSIQNN